MEKKRPGRKRATTEGRWLQQTAAAAYLGVGVSTFKGWRRKYPDFPKPVQMSPTAIMFDKKDLDEWIERRKDEARQKENEVA